MRGASLSGGQPFPLPVRTLDAVHLASMVFLTTRGLGVRLATYDVRQATVARAMGFEVVEPLGRM